MPDPARPKASRPRVGRRTFLSALGALACSAPRPRSPAPPSKARAAASSRGPRSVIVVGAGLAGLTTAHRLLQAGLDVQVLESEPRVGGRIRTVREGLVEGQYLELGARHVLSHPSLLALCEEFGVRRFSPWRDPRSEIARRQGVLRSGVRRSVPPADLPDEDAQLSPAERALAFPDRLTHYFQEVRGRKPQELGWDSGLRELDGISAADYLRRQGASPGFIQLIEGALVPGDSIEQSSALAIMRDAASFRREISLPRGDSRIAGGSDRLPRAIAKALGERVHLSAPVRELVQGPERVDVHYEAKGQVRVMRAERVVCALPYTALADVRFSPAPSAAKAGAMSRARMASVTRIWMQCQRRAWLDVGESGRVETDLLVGSIREETDVSGEAGVLGAYLSGARARRWLEIPRADRVARARAELIRAMPSAAGLEGDSGVFCWDDVRSAGGGYSWFAPGELTAAGSAYAAPEGRVHFAGDHVSSRPGFMHGALESVERVVAEITSARE